MSSHDEMTVDELAREAGVSVRNIRYYQQLGLLDAPVRRGRLAYYDAEQLNRLRRICALREEGLSLEAIARLTSAADQDQLRFMQTLLDGATSEAPARMTLESLGASLGYSGQGAAADRALDTVFFNRLGDGEIEVRSPALTRIGAQLAELDVPLGDAAELLSVLEEHLGAIADAYIRLFIERIWRPATTGGDDVPWAELEQTLVRLRGLAGESVAVAFALLMSDSTERAREEEMSVAGVAAD
jgi:DNA-binding transcriptional MerR regulator